MNETLLSLLEGERVSVQGKTFNNLPPLMPRWGSSAEFPICSHRDIDQSASDGRHPNTLPHFQVCFVHLQCKWGNNSSDFQVLVAEVWNLFKVCYLFKLNTFKMYLMMKCTYLNDTLIN